MRKWKWVIILSLSVGALLAGGFGFPAIADGPAWSVFALVFGCFGTGYACSRLDQDIGAICIRIQVDHWKPHITITKVEH